MKSFTKPEDVRGESLTFEILVLDTMKNVEHLFPEVMKERELTQWFRLEAAIMGLDALVAPYYDETYTEKVNAIKHKLDRMRNSYDRVKYICYCREWLQEIVKRFGVIAMLPKPRKTQRIGDEEDDEASVD